MSAPPPLTDRASLALHRRRAERQGMASFVHDLAADEIEERLAEVNRRFTEIAVVTGHPAVWRARFPQARIVPDDDLLDLTPGAHDLVIHALGLHWANDPVGQLVQARRALRPDGLLLCVSFGGQTLAELRAALAETEAALVGGLSPRVLPMGEIRDLGALLQRAGLALPVADSADPDGDLRKPPRTPPRPPRHGRGECDDRPRTAHAAAALRGSRKSLRQRVLRARGPHSRDLRARVPHRLGA